MQYVIEAGSKKYFYKTKAEAMKTVKKLIEEETVFYLLKVYVDHSFDCIMYAIFDGFEYTVY